VIAYDAQRGTDLVATLQAWFEAAGRAGRAAEVLHVHPNTVAQRLDRIGDLLGPGWREPSAALEQQVALRLWQLRRMA
jgi:DNA-binding PucR family transcriptional regulator